MKTKFEDIASMALIYINRIGRNMISYDKVIQYEKIVNENLEKMDSNIDCSLSYDEESLLYFHATDEDGKVYLVIDPKADLKRAREYHIGTLPLDIVLASQMPNALSVIGLELKNGKLIQKKQKEHKMDPEEIITSILENPRAFYIKIADTLSIEESDYLKILIENKSCFNCTNGTCKIQSFDKLSNDYCVAWDNKELVGKQKIYNKLKK